MICINDYTSIASVIQQDIIDWSTNWVEQPNEFHNYKFPVCPYAQKTRIENQVNIKVYTGGSIKNFINACVNELVSNKTHQVTLVVLPPRAKYHPTLKKFITKLNTKTLISNDFFAFMGSAATTTSRYPGIFNSGPYCLIGINTLSMVLSAVETLKKSNYYGLWSKKHYKEVVEYRQEMVSRYKKEYL